MSAADMSNWSQQFTKPSKETPFSAFGHIDDDSYKTPPKSYPDGTWVKLDCGNDWGHNYWTLPGEKLTEHGMASRSLGRDLAGQLLSVCWPDGYISKSYIALDMEIVQVSDHGHTSNVHNIVYWVGVNIHDIGIKINIKDLQFDKDEIESLPFLSV